MSDYLDKISATKSKKIHDLKEVGDQWRTPDPLFFGIEKMILSTLEPTPPIHQPRFVLDLFSDGQNAKTANYYTAEQNALKQNWTDDLEIIGRENDYAYANPPYSVNQFDDDGDALTGMAPIMEKVLAEREKGGRFALLIKSATSETWWPDNLPDRTIFIKGRIGFDLPVWFNNPNAKKQAAFFGGAVLIFNKSLSYQPKPRYISRKLLEETGAPIAQEYAERRRRHIENFEL